MVKNGLNIEERTEPDGIFNSNEAEVANTLWESQSLEGKAHLQSHSNSHLDNGLESILEEQETEGTQALFPQHY